MKVIYVFPHLPDSDSESETYERAIRERYLLSRSSQDGVETRLFFLTHNFNVFIKRDESSDVVFFPIDNEGRGKDRKFYLSTKMLYTIDEIDPDLVIFKGMGYLLPAWLVKNGKCAYRYAFIIGGATQDLLAKHAAFILAEYPGQIVNLRNHRRNRSWEILPKYVPEKDFFNPGESTKNYDVINVGDFINRKNQQAIVPLAENHKLIFLGTGPLFNQVRKFSEQYDDRVTFIGAVGKSEVSSWVSQARLMVHPSKSEGFPRSFAESFACGVPVIASRSAIKGSFPDGVAGKLVDPDNLLSSADALLSDTQELDSLSRGAYEYACTTFGGDQVYAAVESLYRHVLSEIERGVPVRRPSILGIRIVLWSIWKHLYLIIRNLKRRFL